MDNPIFVLAPPGSCSSPMVAMLGQHPKLCDLPEVNLFVAETVGQRANLLSQVPFAEHGLLRAIAQFFSGEQTIQTILLAQRWLSIRADCTVEEVFYELAIKTGTRLLVDGSSLNTKSIEHLQRVRKFFTRPRFIHLVQHPRSQGNALWQRNRIIMSYPLMRSNGRFAADGQVDFQDVWYNAHINIKTFLDQIPGQWKIRVRIEDLLSQPNRVLRQIVDWLGLFADQSIIETMKHPERSAFASLGPPNALLGNDPAFLLAPRESIRTRVNGETLEGPLTWRSDGRGFNPAVKALARYFGYL